MTRSKSIVGALALIMASLLAACSSLAGRHPARPRPAAAPTAARPGGTERGGRTTYADMTVGFIQTGSESGWRAANTASFKETAEQLGITLKFYDAQNKLENQLGVPPTSSPMTKST
jgi:simple sugar transport system substrate-binding protein